MVIYVIVSIVSTLLTYMANKVIRNKLLFILISFFVLFIPAYIAGCRDLTVGFDVMYYGYGIYESAHTCSSFLELIKSEPKAEIFYLFVNYLAVSLYDDINFTLGFISFCTLLFAYLACYKLRNNISMWILYAGFMIVFFANSMNYLRQSLAMSVCFYAYSIMRTNGISWKFVLTIILAILSHNTAIVAVSSILIYFFMSKQPKKKFSKYFYIFILGISIFLYGINYIVSIIAPILNKDFSTYLDSSNSDAAWAETIFPVTYIITVVLFIISYYWGYKKHFISLKDLHEFKCNTVVFALCLIMGFTMTGTMLRLTSYFLIFMFCEFCLIISNRQIPIGKRNVYKFLIILLYFVLFLKSTGPNVIYSSSILSIK